MAARPTYIATGVMLLLMLPGTMGLAQGVEEQRKYLIPGDSMLMLLRQDSLGWEGLSSHTHATYTYYDLYLDTRDLALYRSGLSLRFRKRVVNGQADSYALQLKSEMDDAAGMRMEVDEPELDFYKVRTDTGWISLTHLLDRFFHRMDSTGAAPLGKEIDSLTNLLKDWIAFKSEGLIAPFQKISHLNLKHFKPKDIPRLEPVLIGRSVRRRSHLYIDPLATLPDLEGLPVNRKSDCPAYFKEHPQFNYVMESSLDSSVFYPMWASRRTSALIQEFEVENKYHIPTRGSELMNRLEAGLRREYGLENGRDSKYRQSIQLIEPNL